MVERMRIDSEGNVGIGTGSPTQRLHLGEATTGIRFGVPGAPAQGDVKYTASGEEFLDLSIKGTTNGYGNIRFSTGPEAEERFRVTSTGLLQTGSPSGAGAGGGWQVYTADKDTVSQRGRMAFAAHPNCNESQEIMQIYKNNFEALRITVSGNVTNKNNSYGALSDAKLKENIVDASSQWEDLKAVQVRNYDLISTGEHHLGVVAQEIEQVSPGLVSDTPDRDEEGNDLGTVTKSVNYSVLYLKAVKALQEAMERIETLEQKVADLEG